MTEAQISLAGALHIASSNRYLLLAAIAVHHPSTSSASALSTVLYRSRLVHAYNLPSIRPFRDYLR